MDFETKFIKQLDAIRESVKSEIQTINKINLDVIVKQFQTFDELAFDESFQVYVNEKRLVLNDLRNWMMNLSGVMEFIVSDKINKEAKELSAKGDEFKQEDIEGIKAMWKKVWTKNSNLETSDTDTLDAKWIIADKDVLSVMDKKWIIEAKKFLSDTALQQAWEGFVNLT